MKFRASGSRNCGMNGRDWIYPWVMAGNAAVRNFYQGLGPMNAGEMDKPNPGGAGSAMNCRYMLPGQAP